MAPYLRKWKTPRNGVSSGRDRETTYLGGLTFPGITSRPHMGPFNRVAPGKISDADEVYRQHDIGYSREVAAGRNPYLQWNKYDEMLVSSPNYGWPDYLAKGIFGLKAGLVGMGLPQPYGKFTKGLRKSGIEDGQGARGTYVPRHGKIRSRVRYEKY